MKEFHKYPKIKIIGNVENKDINLNPDDEIVIEEKIDGANFRFMYHNGKFIFGSRTRELGETDKDNKSWGKCIGYIKKMFKKPEDNTTYNNYIFYGECCIRHSTPYDFANMPPFLGFDILDITTGKFIDYKKSKKLYEKLNLIFVPIINVINASEMIAYEDKDVPQSKYYDGQAEGVVFKNYERQIMGKFVTKKHREENMKVFGGSKKWATNDTDRMIAMYCTNPRIEKQIFKLIHEGNELDMPLMKYLHKNVFDDIIEEHYKDILSNGHKLDMRYFKTQVAKRCVSVLKLMISHSINSEV